MRFLLTIAAIVGFWWTIGRARRKQVTLPVAIAWSLPWVAVVIVALVPEFTSRLASILGIGRGADLVLYSAIVVILALLVRMSVRLEQLDRAVTRVTRELALRDREHESR